MGFGDPVYEFNHKPMESLPMNRLKIIMRQAHHIRNVSSFFEVKKNYRKTKIKKASFQKPANRTSGSKNEISSQNKVEEKLQSVNNKI